MSKVRSVSHEMMVSDLLAACPPAAGVFLRHHMACLGCTLSCFETLGDAAANYGLPMHTFLAELERATDSVAFDDTSPQR